MGKTQQSRRALNLAVLSGVLTMPHVGMEVFRV